MIECVESGPGHGFCGCLEELPDASSCVFEEATNGVIEIGQVDLELAIG